MPHTAIDPDLLISDEDVRNSAMRLHRERNLKRITAVVVMFTVLALGVLFTLLTYSSP